MAGRAYDPRFVFTWPNHRIAVMGPKQLAGVLSIVRRNAAEARAAPSTSGRRGAAPGHREPDRGGVDGAVRHGAPVGRRHHRPAGHAHRARHRTDGRALGGGARDRGLRCGPALMAPRLSAGSVANRGEIARRLISGAHDAGCEAVAVFARGRRRQPRTWARRTRRPAARGLARRDVSPAAELVRAAGAGGSRRPAPGLRVPVREPRAGRGVRGGGHRLGRPAARRDAGHGPQGAGQGAGGGRRCARAAERRAWRQGPTRQRSTPPPRPSVPPSGQGVGRRRGRGMRLVREPGRAERGRHLGAAGGRRRVRLRRRVLGALPGGPPARRGPGDRGHPRHRAAPLRSGVLGAAAAPEGGGGGPGRPRARLGPRRHVGGRGVGGAGRRLRGGGHGGVPGRCRRLLLPRDEHAAPGRARRHRAGDRARPGGPATGGGRRAAPPLRPGRGVDARSRRGGAALRRTAPGGLPADARHGRPRAVARGAGTADRRAPSSPAAS